MWRIYIVVLVAWAAMMPPFFTAGACTAEFDAESARLKRDANQFRKLDLATDYWRSRGIAIANLSQEQCRQANRYFAAQCGKGTTITVRVPVENRICRFYRDSEIKTHLQYDEAGRLTRMATDMKPFLSLPIPFTSTTIHWAR
jgi:hypothetical protein